MSKPPLLWTRQSLHAFLTDALGQGDGEVHLIVHPRREVATGLWYELTWCSAAGKKRCVIGSSLEIVLRRASEIERADRAEAGLLDHDDE